MDTKNIFDKLNLGVFSYLFGVKYHRFIWKNELEIVTMGEVGQFISAPKNTNSMLFLHINTLYNIFSLFIE